MIAQTHIDRKENGLLKIDISLLEILLQDKTTGRNLIWATDNYAKHGEQYSADRQISAELVTLFKPLITRHKIRILVKGYGVFI